LASARRNKLPLLKNNGDTLFPLSMATLQVPPRHFDSILTLRGMSAADFERFVEALGSAPPTVRSSQIAKDISAQLAGMAEEDVRKLVDMVLTLCIVRAQAEVGLGTFLDDLHDALNETGIPGLKVSQDNVDEFNIRFTRLLELPRLKTVSKATALRTEYANTFCDAKILTDIRSVFDDSVIEGPSAAVISHSLKIEYHHGTRHKEIYVSLDAADLDTLGEVLERAREKAASLSRILAKAEIPNLD